MIRMCISRFKSTSEVTLGTFLLLDEKNTLLQRGFTLEPKGPSTMKANTNRRIPKGVYNTTMRFSPHFHERLPLLWNDKVDKKRHILIHAGNYSTDTQGCILVGDVVKEDYILQSRKTLNTLLNITRDKEFVVEIRDGY